MTKAAVLSEVWRGDILESQHLGHAVICGEDGEVIDAWGDPEAVVYPRSSAKMIQALPMVESGVAAEFGLTTQQLALSCASHNGAAIHIDGVSRWLADLGLSEADLRCGPQEPKDVTERNRLIRADIAPGLMHNNCSGKHSGFLTLNAKLQGGPEYTELDHPVQLAVLQAFEEVTQNASMGVGIDGCSAPNFATTMVAMARAMSAFAAAEPGQGARADAMVRLREAMTAHPDLVAGEGRACTELMRAMEGRVAVKTGAEAYYIAIVPEKKMGIAVKVIDGGTRGAECAITALLVRIGVLDAAHPTAQKWMNRPLKNWAGIEIGKMNPAASLLA